MFQTGVIDALRDWGLTVRTVTGWQTRGSSHFDPRGHVIHHDVIGDQAGTHDRTPDLIINGRSDLPGPLCNFWLERDGDVHLVAAGRANHAGEGGWLGLSGNDTVWGTEMNNLGTPADPWPEVQLTAMERLAAATCEFSGFAPATVCGHKEWAPTRKIDPHSIDMATFRSEVLAQAKGGLMADQADRIIDVITAKHKRRRETEVLILTHLRAIRQKLGTAEKDLREIDLKIDELLAEDD